MDPGAHDDPERRGRRGPVMFDPHHISAAELAELGQGHLAYIKPVMTQDGPAFAIHGADGAPLALATDREVAIAAVIQQEMMPALVH